MEDADRIWIEKTRPRFVGDEPLLYENFCPHLHEERHGSFVDENNNIREIVVIILNPNRWELETPYF